MRKTFMSDTLQRFYDRVPLLRDSFLNTASVMGSTVRDSPQMMAPLINQRYSAELEKAPSTEPVDKEEFVRTNNSVLGIKITKPVSRHATTFSADRLSAQDFVSGSSR